MSARVNPLVVMDAFIDCAQFSSAHPPMRMSDARAQVAELAMVAAEAPNLSRYHGARGFELERFIVDYEAWAATKRAALAPFTEPTA